jgi:hypothetical protein
MSRGTLVAAAVWLVAGCGGAPASETSANGSESLSSPSVQTIPADTFPQRTGCGAGWGGGYLQACNGNIATSFNATSSGTYSITVDAGGQYGVGGWPNMQLLVDGVVQGSWTVALWAPSTNAFTASVGLSAGSHTLSVAFTNDAYAPGTQYPDRNLYIHDVAITPPAPAPAPAPAPPPPPPPASPTTYTYQCSTKAYDNWGGGSLQLIVWADGSQVSVAGYLWPRATPPVLNPGYTDSYWFGYTELTAGMRNGAPSGTLWHWGGVYPCTLTGSK